MFTGLLQDEGMIGVLRACIEVAYLIRCSVQHLLFSLFNKHLLRASIYNSGIYEHLILSPLGTCLGHLIGDGLMVRDLWSGPVDREDMLMIGRMREVEWKVDSKFHRIDELLGICSTYDSN